jgi:hypothetical protein
MSVREFIRDMDWEDLADAVELVATGKAKRIDGECWKIYMVPGNIIRVDIALNNHQ